MKAMPTSVAPKAPARSHPKYIASCAANGPGDNWRKCQTFQIVLLGHPAAAFHQFSLHVACERDGTAKAKRSQTQKVEKEIAQGKRRQRGAV